MDLEGFFNGIRTGVRIFPRLANTLAKTRATEL